MDKFVMNNQIMRRILVVLCLSCLTTAVSAQTKKYTEKDYARSPVWIQMIRDTTTNFFEVEKAYKTYFSNHEMPSGEHDIMGERDKQEKYPTKKEKRQLESENRMRMEVKKYQHWHDMMLPYVQPDGSILTPSERWTMHRNLQNKH